MQPALLPVGAALRVEQAHQLMNVRAGRQS